MANSFGTDVLIQAQDPKKAALFYVTQLEFAITDEKADLISLHGENLNLFIERGVALGPVLEVTVEHIEEAKARLVRNGCVIIEDESNSRGATSRGPVRRHLQPDDLRPARRKRSHAKHAQLGKIELSCLRQ
jgi:hypothetical protein